MGIFPDVNWRKMKNNTQKKKCQQVFSNANPSSHCSWAVSTFEWAHANTHANAHHNKIFAACTGKLFCNDLSWCILYRQHTVTRRCYAKIVLPASRLTRSCTDLNGDSFHAMLALSCGPAKCQWCIGDARALVRSSKWRTSSRSHVKKRTRSRSHSLTKEWRSFQRSFQCYFQCPFLSKLKFWKTIFWIIFIVY